MDYIIREKDGALHLFEDKLLDNDLGELHKTFTGKLETRNVFKTNYTLEDISGLLSRGDKYSITSNKGLSGTLTRTSKRRGTFRFEP